MKPTLGKNFPAYFSPLCVCVCAYTCVFFLLKILGAKAILFICEKFENVSVHSSYLAILLITFLKLSFS